MATPEKRDKVRHEVRTGLDELSAIDPSSLGRRSELSPTINFEDVVPDLTAMLDIVKQLQQRDISRLPFTELDRIKNGLLPLRDRITEVRDFTLEQGSPHEACENLKTQITSMYDDLVHALMISLSFTATQATDYARIEREALGFHTRLQEQANEFQQTLESQKADAEAALAAIQEQAAQAGVSAHAQHFHKQAELHKSAAINWFRATVVAASVTLVAAVASLVAVFFYTPENVAEAVQYGVAKVIVLSVLTFAIVWSSRNYRSEKHNEMLNRHRANSLGTFQTFHSGTSDPATKSAVLVFCAEAAFGSRPTGYDRHESPDGLPQIVNPVIDILGKHGEK